MLIKILLGLLLIFLQSIPPQAEVRCGDVFHCPVVVQALQDRARLYALQFDYDSAIEDTDTAIQLAEENNLDETRLAELYTKRGEYVLLLYEWDQALVDFNSAIVLDPSYAPAYFQRGVLYYTMAQRELAIADFASYHELSPNGAYAHLSQSYIESIQTELQALSNP